MVEETMDDADKYNTVDHQIVQGVMPDTETTLSEAKAVGRIPARIGC